MQYMTREERMIDLEKMVNTVLHTFFTSKYDEDGAYTYEWCEKTHCPVVRGLNGKVVINVFSTTSPINTLHIAKRVFGLGERGWLNVW